MIGSAGAGKSTFAVTLGQLLKLPVFHLDKLFWKPGWIPAQKNGWRRTQQALVAKERWIIDGNYDSTLDIRFARADTVFHLDFPRRMCLWRVGKRIVTGLGRTRPDMAPGCPERIDFPFLKWVWRFRRDVRPNIVAILRNHPSVNVITLRNATAARDYLNGIKAAPGNRPTCCPEQEE